MTGKTKVVVELTADEDRLLQGFRKAEAADKALRSGLTETGATGDRSGKAIADAMLKASSTVTRTTNQMLAELRKAGPEGSKIFGRMAGDLVDFEQAGRKSIDTILDRLEKVDPVVAAMAANARQELAAIDKSAKFEETRRNIEALGGDFAILGKEIKKATDAPLEKADDAARRMVTELMKIDPDKAQQIAKALDNASEAINQSRLNNFIGQLAAGSKEAQALAKALGDDTKRAALEAEGGIDGLANKIVALRPELKSTVEQWRSEMAEAAKFGEGQYEKALNALRAGDPISKKVAEKIKQHLVESGKIVEKTFEDMIVPLEKIDPAMAEQARKMRENLQTIEDDGKGAFVRFKQSAIAQITGIIGAYAGLQEAIQFTSKLIQDQQNLLKDSADKIKEFAIAKEEAFKNLSALPEPVRVDLMNRFIKEVMEKSDVSDPGSIATAIGDAISAGANVRQAKSAALTASILNPLNPEKIPSASGAFVDIQRATGVVSAEQVASQLFLAGSQSRVVVPSKLFRNAAPVAATAAGVAGDARREEGALEGLALFAAFSKAGSDTQGDASQTAAIQLQKRLESFFDNLGKDASDARKELAKLKQEDPLSNQQRLMLTKLSNQEASQDPTNAKIKQLEAEIAAIQQQQDAGGLRGEQARELSVQKRKLKASLSDVKEQQFSKMDEARLADLRAHIGEADRKFQEQVGKLQGKIAAEQIKGFEGRVPETVGDMFAALQSSPQLRDAFLADKFGEQRFRTAISSSVTGGETFRDYQQARKLLVENRGSDRIFREQVRISRNLDPHLREALIQQKAEAAEVSQKIFNLQGAAAGSFREQLAKVLLETRSNDPVSSGLQAIGEIGVQSGVLLGGDIGAEELFSGLTRVTTRLKQNRSDFGADGQITEDEASKLGRLNRFIEVTLERFNTENIQRDPNLRSVAHTVRHANLGAFSDPGTMFAVQENEGVFQRLERILAAQVDLMQEQLKETKKTEKNTRPSGTRNGNAQAAAAAASNARATP